MSPFFPKNVFQLIDKPKAENVEKYFREKVKNISHDHGQGLTGTRFILALSAGPFFRNFVCSRLKINSLKRLKGTQITGSP